MLKRKGFFILMVVTLILVFWNLLAQEKGVRSISYKKGGKEVVFCKRSYALVIGVWDYDYWEKFNRTSFEKEISQVENVLKEHDFNVRRLNNPSFNEIERAIKDFKNDYGLDKDNRLLIFFSGHGYSRREHTKGYLVPKDAPFPDPGNEIKEKEFLKKSISMDWLKTMAREIEANQVLFLFDSCFSGTIFQTKSTTVPEYINEEMANPVRQFITAGKANQRVPAKSVFIPALIQGLKGKADLYPDGYITGKELYLYIKREVEKRQGKAQNPQYGSVPVSDYEGDFVFVTKKKKEGKEKEIFIGKPDLKAIESKTRKVHENHKGFWEAEFDEGIVMVYIPPSSFVMGYENGSEDEKPEHKVNLDGYWIGMYEITFGQFRRFVRATGYITDAEKEGGSFTLGYSGDKWEKNEDSSWEETEHFDEWMENNYNHPVVCVSWNDCLAYAAWLSQKTGLGFSLPTEAQWEMACRGPVGRKYPWGNDSIVTPRTQTHEGYIVGIVMDDEGNGLPGVTLELYGDTSKKAVEVSNAFGYFKFDTLFPLEDYVLKALLPGFKTSKITDIPAKPNAISRVNIVLEMGSMEEEIVQAQVFDRNMFLENVQKSKANIADLEFWFNTRKDWSNKNIDDGYFITAVVGSFFDGDSPYGIMDMAGNVWEWCHDLYEQNFYSKSPFLNPKGPSYGSTRVIRGGGWNSNVGDIRASNRDSKKQSYSSDFLGFRLVMTEK